MILNGQGSRSARWEAERRVGGEKGVEIVGEVESLGIVGGSRVVKVGRLRSLGGGCGVCCVSIVLW